MQFTGRVNQGSLILKESAKWKEIIKKLEGKEVQLGIEKKKRKRSISQNNYYWLIVTLISESTTHTMEEIHEACRRKFLARKEITIQGETLLIPRSTTELSTVEFSEYIERVRCFAAELGVVTPDPL